MGKILKIISIILAILILLSILGAILLVTFVSPNRFKPLITKEVSAATGREFTIEGDINWSFLPYLGVKLNRMTLNNPAGFNQPIFAKVDHATLTLSWLPLLRGKIRSNGITLDNIQIHLIKNSQGKVNWQMAPPIPVTPKEKPITLHTSHHALELDISHIDVKHANIQYIDEQKNTAYTIKNLALHAKDISLLAPFPVSTTLDFIAQPLSMHLTFSGRIALNQPSQIYSVRDIQLTVNGQQQQKKFDFQVSGNLIADLKQQTVQLTDLVTTSKPFIMNGAIKITQLSSNPIVAGHLHIPPFDLKQWLQTVDPNNDVLQSAKNVSGDIDFNVSPKNVNANGKFNVAALQAAKLKMTHVNLTAVWQNGILNLSPLTANLYQGNLTSQIKINTQATVPTLSIIADLTNIQSAPLIADLSNKPTKLQINGGANLSLNVTTAGQEKTVLLRNLNGIARFNFNNGYINGIDLGYLVDSAYALATQQALSSQNTDKTPFGAVTGSATIQNGVLSNNDLLLNAPRFITNGKGIIDLNLQKINYALQVLVKKVNSQQKDDLHNLYGLPIPVLISGNLSSPSIRLDSATLAKALAQYQIQKTTDKLQEKIKEQLPGQAGELLQNFLGH